MSQAAKRKFGFRSPVESPQHGFGRFFYTSSTPHPAAHCCAQPPLLSSNHGQVPRTQQAVARLQPSWAILKSSTNWKPPKSSYRPVFALWFYRLHMKATAQDSSDRTRSMMMVRKIPTETGITPFSMLLQQLESFWPPLLAHGIQRVVLKSDPLETKRDWTKTLPMQLVYAPA